MRLLRYKNELRCFFIISAIIVQLSITVTGFSETTKTIFHTNDVTSIDFDPSGSWMVTGSHDGSLLVWDTSNWQLAKVLLKPNEDIVDGSALRPYKNLLWATFSLDGALVAAGSRDGRVRVWNTSSWKELWVARESPRAVHVVTFSPDSQYVVTGGIDTYIRILNAKTGVLIKEWIGHEWAIRGLVFSSDGKHLFSAGRDGKLKWWDFLSEKSKKKEMTVGDGVFSLAINSEGDLLAIGTHCGEIKLLNLKTEKLRTISKENKSIVYGLNFSPNTSLLAGTGYKGSLQLLKPDSTGYEKSILQGHFDPIRSLAFSPDGQLIGTASFDNTIRIWNVTTRETVRILSFKGSHAP